MGKSFQYKGIKVRYKASSGVYYVQFDDHRHASTSEVMMKKVIDYQLAMSKPRYSSELNQKISKLSSDLYLNFFDSISSGHSIVRTDEKEFVSFSWIIQLNSSRSVNIDERVCEHLADFGLTSICYLQRRGRGLRLTIKIPIEDINTKM